MTNIFLNFLKGWLISDKLLGFMRQLIHEEKPPSAVGAEGGRKM